MDFSNPFLWFIIISIIVNILRKVLGNDKEKKSAPPRRPPVQQRPVSRHPGRTQSQPSPPTPMRKTEEPSSPRTVKTHFPQTSQPPVEARKAETPSIPRTVQPQPQPTAEKKDKREVITKKTKTLLQDLLDEFEDELPIPKTIKPPQKRKPETEKEVKKIEEFQEVEFDEEPEKEKIEVSPYGKKTKTKTFSLQARLHKPPDLRRAIIMTEVLGPCKAKRQR